MDEQNKSNSSAENNPAPPETEAPPKNPAAFPATSGQLALPDEQTSAVATNSEATPPTEVGKGGGGGELGRPAPPSRARPPRRSRRRGIWGWVLVGMLGIAAGVGTFLYIRSTQTSTVFQGLTTNPSTRQPVSLAVSASGQIQANADVSLSFGSSGTVTEVNIKQGDRVKKGDVLAKIDDAELQNSVKSAKASLEQQQASLAKTMAGATDKEIEQAQASLKQAQAKYDQTKNGNALPQEISNAQAQLRSAQAKLTQDKQGGTPEEIAAAKSAVSSAEAQLASAQAKLEKDLAGPDNATIVAAQAKYDQAVLTLEKQKSQLESSVVSAQSARDQALNSLRNAQDKYNSIYSDNHKADGSLKDGLSDTQKDNETSAYRSLQDAQSSYNKADVALNDARKQYDAGVKTYQSQVDDAKASLDKTKAGSTAADIASDRASVASAQSSLDSARKSLTALTPTAATIASDEASIASAQSSLAKLVGGTDTDVANAQASVDSANATLKDLLAGPKPNDIAISQAQVNQAQASYDSALLKLKNAVITAPFDGVVTTSNLVVGQSVQASATAFQLVDTSSLRVDVNVGEADIAKIKLGQAAAINLDAISGKSFTGKITYISSKSSVSNNVVNYLVTVTLDTNSTNTFNEVWGTELAKYFQALSAGGSNQSQGQGQNGSNFPGGGGFPGGASGGGFPGGAPPSGIQIPASVLSQLGVCGYSPTLPGSTDNSTADSNQPKVGMTSNVTVCLNLKAGVLAIPNRAIKTKFENGQQVKYVQVLLDKNTGKTEDRPITTGLAGDSYTEVTGGNLSQTDKLVLSTTPTNVSTSTSNFPPLPG